MNAQSKPKVFIKAGPKVLDVTALMAAKIKKF